MARQGLQSAGHPQRHGQATAGLVEKAWRAFAGGDWRGAEPLCRSALRSQPAQYGALTLLGIITAQTGRSGEAEALLRRALAAAPSDPGAHNNHGNILRDLGRHLEALQRYEQAIALREDYAEAHYNRGSVLQALGRHEEALQSFDRAIALQGDHAAAHNNRGLSLRELDRPGDALAAFDQALAANPQHAGAYHNRGVTLQELGRVDEALLSYEQSLALRPDDAGTWRNRGHALCRIGSYEESLHCYRQALRIDPRSADAHNGLGVTLRHAHDMAGAQRCFEQALALDPGHAEAHFNLGNLQRDRGQLDQALACYASAVAARPGYADAFKCQGAVLHELGRVAEALASYRRALQIDPELPWLYGLYVSARMQVCDWDGIDRELQELRHRIEAAQSAATPFSAATLFDSPPLQRRCAELWATRNAPTRRLPPPARPAPGQRIRIGYYSADFYNHATSVLASELFAQHDRGRFEIFGFRFGIHPDDEVTRRLATGFDHFIDVRERSDAQIAGLSRELQIDIAVDLKGYTQHHRAGVFAQRAAPLQVNYLGFPGTLGASHVDYLIADRTVIPAHARQHYMEKIVHLPDSYQVNGRSRLIAPRAPCRAELGLPAEAFVLCCFNSVYKITPEVFNVWMAALQRLPDAVLWLLDGGPEANSNLRSAAQHRGISAHRLLFAPRVALPDHLARHGAADLFLDTWPCNAHTTASDALWAGLPLLTLAGESFASRVATSLLVAVGLPELVAKSLPQYESMIVALAADRVRLSRYRERLDRDRLTSPLFDVQRYAACLEEGYRRMYERLQCGLQPDHIVIEAPACSH